MRKLAITLGFVSAIIPAVAQGPTVDYPSMGTAIILTATAEATGDVNSQSEEADVYALTATQHVANATATVVAIASSQSEFQVTTPAIWLIIMGIIAVVIVLIVYNRLTTVEKQKRKR